MCQIDQGEGARQVGDETHTEKKQEVVGEIHLFVFPVATLEHVARGCRTD